MGDSARKKNFFWSSSLMLVGGKLHESSIILETAVDLESTFAPLIVWRFIFFDENCETIKNFGSIKISFLDLFNFEIQVTFPPSTLVP